MWCCQSEGTLQSKQHGLLTCIWVSYRYTYIKHTFSVSQDKNMFKSDDSQGTLTNNVLFIWIGAHGTGVIIHICIYIYKYIYMYACMYIYIYMVAPPRKKNISFCVQTSRSLQRHLDQVDKLIHLFLGWKASNKDHQRKIRSAIAAQLAPGWLSPFGLVDFGFPVILKISFSCK